MNIRLAKTKDIKQLIKMRWGFTIEFDETKMIEQSLFSEFEKECEMFLEAAIKNNEWFIWVAEDEGKIVSHIYIELIQKVPRPGRTTHPFAYMTNVYTLLEYRNKGIGTEILSKINQWAKDQNYEFIIVWPSSDSVNYYKKNNYVECTEAMTYFPS